MIYDHLLYVHPKAIQDYTDAYAYYFVNNESIAASFENRVVEYFGFIKDNPQ